ncbi:replication initiation protein [Endozoicomonas sp. SM1973]|uniref:Replication initiation protein n=1 Tax=Spartinivicinus marinus TaxID=2994442 RepID=A0A853IKS5_9GAMM|nr:replication initiation protein [Spartinivicinus marinus]MCX4030443.1 replication initiation protein [Spartinivicinus marinus]NYZ69675.1 replication initiation protein [Spartinivicinus marinus]
MAQNNLVVKRNELIEGNYSLSAVAQKVAAAVIAKVNPEADSLPTIKLSAREAIELLGISKQYFYREMDNITDELGRILIRHNQLDEKKLVKSNFFLRSTYDETDKSVTFEFHPDIEPYIRDFRRNFTKYQIRQIRNLNSKYSIRVYEVLRKYHPIKCSRSESYYEVGIDEFRSMMGIEEGKHQRISNLREYVLKRAEKELTEKTDLTFKFKMLRKARKISSIKFTIYHNQRNIKQEATNKDDPEVLTEQEEQLFSDLSTLIKGIEVKEVKAALKFYAVEVLQEAMFTYFLAQTRGRDIKNPKSYYFGICKKLNDHYKPTQNNTSSDADSRGLAKELLDDDWAKVMLDEFVDGDENIDV